MSGRNWLIAIVLCFLVGGYVGNILLLASGVFLLIMALICWLWNRLSLRRIAFARYISTRRAFWGEIISYEMILENNKILPLPWLHLEDVVPKKLGFYVGDEIILPVDDAFSPLSHRTLVATVSSGGFERIRQRYEIPCKKRGYYSFGPAHVITGDLLTFKENIASFSHIDELLVYPRYVPVHGFRLLARQPYGDYTGSRKDMEDLLRPVGVRNYHQGDSWRRIHWKATSRSSTLQTKIYEKTVTPEPILFLNVDSVEKFKYRHTATLPNYHGEESDQGQFFINDSILELAITVVSSLANYIIEAGYPVGIYANGLSSDEDHHVLRILPSSQKGQFVHILEELARFFPKESISMATFLAEQCRNLPYSTSIVLVTAILDEELISVLYHLKRYRQLTIIYIGSELDDIDISGINFLRLRGRPKWDELEEIDLV